MGLWVEIGGFMGCLWWHWVCGLRSECLWVVYGGVLLGGWWVFVRCGNCGFMHLPVVSYALILFVFVTFVCSLSLSLAISLLILCILFDFVCSLSLSQFRLTLLGKCGYCASCLISFAVLNSDQAQCVGSTTLSKKMSLTSEICTWEQDPNKNLLELWKK